MDAGRPDSESESISDSESPAALPVLGQLETAINIGFSCKVLLPTMKIVKIQCADDKDESKARMMARFRDTLRTIDRVRRRRRRAC